MSIELSANEIYRLKRLHRELKNKRDAKNAYRVNTIILLAKGYSYPEVAEILLLDETTIREYAAKFEAGGLKELLANYYKPYEGYLFKEEIEILRKELDSKIYMESASVCGFIFDTFGVEYTERGCRDLLRRIGYVYKKPVGVPEKADAEAQRKFVKRYKRLKRQKKQGEVFLFTDAVHPTYNSKPAYGWIRKGEERQIKQTTGRQRINIIGSLNIDTKQVHPSEHKTVNTEAFIEHLAMLMAIYNDAPLVRVFVDNAKYFKNKSVFKFVKGTNFYIEFLPTYAPNLNIIERLWKKMKKVVKANNFISTFKGFLSEINKFLTDWTSRFFDEAKSLLTENFQIIALSI